MRTSVGCRTVEVSNQHDGINLSMLVMYPASSPESPTQVGPYQLDVALNAPPDQGCYPLVLISHSSGGSHFDYRTLAKHLAGNGFIVGLPVHPFNNSEDNSLRSTAQILALRPKQLSSAIDWFFESPDFAHLLKADAVAVIGHSMGGYTALALAGGKPTSFPTESPDGVSRPVEVKADQRIKALVLLAPATIWYKSAGSLNQVNTPILMLVGEKDNITPQSLYSKIVINGLPDQSELQFRIVENAGHFSFLSPYPENWIDGEFPSSQDLPGFDRASFHQQMNGEILTFLIQKIAK
jgi:predicted dienelactone hydrolase